MIETRIILRSVYSTMLDVKSESKSIDDMLMWMRSFMEPEDVAIVENSKREQNAK